jgi:hypothetical protein
MKAIENTIRLKKRVIENLERISESDIQEISDFVEFITIRRYKGTTKKIKLLPRRDQFSSLWELPVWNLSQNGLTRSYTGDGKQAFY